MQQLANRLPADPEAEKALLGSLLLEQRSISRIATILRPEDFSNERHQTMFRAALELFVKAEPIDNTTWAAALEQITGHNSHHEYLDTLLAEPINSENILSYAQIIKDHSKRRRGIRIGNKLSSSAADVQKSPSEVVNETLSSLFNLGLDGKATEFERAGDRQLEKLVDRLSRRINGEKATAGYSWGFPDLDAITGGFRDGELTIIAGRPSMGKTSMLMNIAVDLAVKQHIPVGIFSLEMSKETLMARLVSQVAGVDSKIILDGTLDEDDLAIIIEKSGALSAAPLYIDDDPDLDEISLLAKSQMIHHTAGVKCILLDYITLMHSATDRSGNREQEVARCVRAIRGVARTLGIPVVACAQLSRKVEDRSDKHPVLSDLRESGDLENAADVVCFMYRDEYYDKNSALKNQAEAIIAKHRNGPIGSVKLGFRKALTQFVSLHQ